MHRSDRSVGPGREAGRRASDRSRAGNQPRRVLNFRFVIVLLVATVTVTAAVYGLHFFQVRRTAQLWLKLAEESEEKGQWDEAVFHLDRYLKLRPDDEEAKAR